MMPLKYLSAYSDQTRAQVAQLIEQDKLAALLRPKYPAADAIRAHAA
jgi:hypothetical protein